MDVGYIALKKFDSVHKSISQAVSLNANLSFVEDLVSLDCTICPSVLQKTFEEDQKYRTFETIGHDIFHSLDYLESRMTGEEGIQSLAILPAPDPLKVKDFHDDRFDFLGFELIDLESMIDPILNCSTFEEIVPLDALNRYGMISDYNSAKMLQADLKRMFSNSDHSDTEIFAVWRKR